jgi:hypothetical protein
LLVARIYDRRTDSAQAAGRAAWRAELVGSISGRGIEIGAGTRLDLCRSGPGVSRRVATEPDRRDSTSAAPGRASRAGSRPSRIDICGRSPRGGSAKLAST